MPGPRRKANNAKKSKSKSKALSVTNATSEDSEFNDLTDDIDGAKGWNEIVNVLCEFLQLPGEDAEQTCHCDFVSQVFPIDLSKRSGLKKIHANFNEIYHNIDDVYVANVRNEKITGGIVGIYTKMCADAILRDKLFQKGRS